MAHSSFKTLEDSEALYFAEQEVIDFYYLINGLINIFLQEQGQNKFSKSIDSKQFFGFKSDEETCRRDLAISSKPNTNIIVFNLKIYLQLKQEKGVSLAEMKINFL